MQTHSVSGHPNGATNRQRGGPDSYITNAFSRWKIDESVNIRRDQDVRISRRRACARIQTKDDERVQLTLCQPRIDNAADKSPE